MKIMMTLRCPECHQKFRVELAAPRFCPLCGYDTQESDDARMARMLDEQRPPAYQKTIKTTVDSLYREMETTSEARVEAAAAHAGVDKSEVSDLRITNMRDNLKEGDAAAMPLPSGQSDEGGKRIAASDVSFVRSPVINEIRSNVVRGPSARSGLASLGAFQGAFGRTPNHIPGK